MLFFFPAFSIVLPVWKRLSRGAAGLWHGRCLKKASPRVSLHVYIGTGRSASAALLLCVRGMPRELARVVPQQSRSGGLLVFQADDVLVRAACSPANSYKNAGRERPHARPLFAGLCTSTCEHILTENIWAAVCMGLFASRTSCRICRIRR